MVTVCLGGALGFSTQAQFREIQRSWIEYSEGAERKGVLLSELRGFLGYGGIIHNFKNYVLRQDPEYQVRAAEQIAAFEAVMDRFRGLTLSPEEAAALSTIEATIDAYAVNLTRAVEAAENGRTPEETDQIVRIDDTAAIESLGTLERIWSGLQDSSTRRLLTAVSQGERLIWLGFLSLFALMIAAAVLGWLFLVLFRNLQRTVAELGDELTERRRLEASEGRLATAVEQSPATILITDTKARIQYVNTKFTELTGWTLEDVRGKTPAFLQSGDAGEEVYRDLRRGVMAGETWHGVFRNLKKDGSSYWAETTILPLLDPEGRIQSFIGIGEDVTETRAAREQVARAQKLEAVGQLAGGVAHDFNNVLTTIIGSAHLAALDAVEDSDLAGEISQIEIAARRAQGLIRELLTFARREPGKVRSVNLSAIAEEVIGLLNSSVPGVIDIRLAPPDGASFVLGDATHLHQIIMNLCRNAAEAMEGAPGEVVVSIATGIAPPDAQTTPDGWVRLTVRDDGPGMSEETQRRLFEPFFTTKPLGKSSGLGLSVVHSLVAEMKGQVTVQSQLGAGTTFVIDLPRAPSVQAEGDAIAETLPRGHERLLVVDDESEVLGTFRRLLTRLGYRVEAFSSPAVALERFQADPSRFDLVMTDMVMPGLTGTELIDEMQKVRRDFPVIYCSAFKTTHIDATESHVEILDKPVEPSKLAQTVRGLLDLKINP